MTRLSLKRKAFLLISSLSLFSIIIVSVLLGLGLKRLLLSNIHANMDSSAGYILESNPFSSMKELKRNLHSKSDTYVKYLKRVKSFNDSMNYSYIYFMEKVDDEIYFVLDNAFLEEGSKIEYTLYESPSKELSNVFEIGESVLSKPYTDEYGTFVSLFKPIKEGSKVTGVIGVDIDLQILKRLNLTVLYIVFGSTLVVLLLILLLSRMTTVWLGKKIDSINELLKAIGEGDLTRRFNITSHDEVGQIGDSFNHAMDNISHLIEKVTRESNSLEDVGGELFSNIIETNSGISKISTNLDSIKDQIISQSSSVSEANSTVEQIVKQAESLSHIIDDQSNNVSESSASIEEMIANIASVTQTLKNNEENIKNLSYSSAEGRGDLSKVVEAIREVAEESEGLLEISKVIQGIARKTNLLSMNAAIEAAHAGDYGSGFAVVAGEIRNLAESSGNQAKTVSAVLNKIKTSIEKITKSTTDVLDKFNLIEKDVNFVSDQEVVILRAMEEQSAGSALVLDSICELKELTDKVRVGSLEMASGSRQVLDETKTLNRVSQELSRNINQISNGTHQINTSVTRVSELSSDNKESSKIVAHEVSRFKINC